MADDIDIETGIKGDKVTLRITSNGGLVTTVTMGPEWGRQIGKQLIGQANLISPPDGPEPGGCIDASKLPPENVRT